MSKRIMIAGGGTGGHIFPAIAIAQAIKAKKPDTQFLFVGAKGKMEMEKVPQAGFDIVGLDISGFNRSSLIKNIRLPFQLIKSFLHAYRLMKKFKPDAVIGVGGYSTFPVLRSAQMQGIPTFIHEANAFAGKSNRMLAKKAVKIFTGTDGMESFFPSGKVMVTGNPVRRSIMNVSDSTNEARKHFGLNEKEFTLLIIGGSLGAVSINKAIAKGLDKLKANGIQLIWQTGKVFIEEAKKACETYNGIWVNDFIQDMDKAYAAADLVVSRSGAMSVAEICVVARPAIFVPYPFAAEDHQTSNAMNLVNKDAADWVRDHEVNDKLIERILLLKKDDNRRNKMKEQLSAIAIEDADERIADEIFKIIGA